MTDSPGWQPLLDAIAAETDPRVRANLELVAEHVVAEVAGDLDRLMDTMAPEPVYRFWGATSSTGPVGAAATRSHYRAMIDSGKNRLDFLVDRVLAGPATVVTEGRFRFAYPGQALVGVTHTEAGERPRPDAWYLADYRCIVVWPFTGGRIAGEELYVGERPRIRRALRDDEHPELGPVGRRTGDTSMWPAV